MAIANICFSVSPKFELPTLLGGRRVDPYRSQTVQVVVTLIWIDNVNRLVATVEPVLDERKQHAIFLLVTVEERTYMACFAKLGAGKRNRCRACLHAALLSRGSPASRTATSR
jgi:hypothetical protein